MDGVRGSSSGAHRGRPGWSSRQGPRGSGVSSLVSCSSPGRWEPDVPRLGVLVAHSMS